MENLVNPVNDLPLINDPSRIINKPHRPISQRVRTHTLTRHKTHLTKLTNRHERRVAHRPEQRLLITRTNQPPVPSTLHELQRRSGSPESKPGGTASLFEEPPVPEHERAVLDRLKRDEAMQLDDLIESLEGNLGSAEIFTALFELELRGRIRQMPGKNYVRCF